MGMVLPSTAARAAPSIPQEAGCAEYRTPLGTSVRVYDSIASIPQQAWDGLFPGAAEDWNYYRTIEGCAPKNFNLGAMAAMRGDAVVAAAPLFRTTYELHTSLQGRLRSFADRVASLAPRLVQLPVMALGSPLLDRCDLGFARDADPAERANLMRSMLDALRQKAAAERIPLLGLKDVSDADAQAFEAPLSESGFARMTNVPMTYIDLPFRNEDAYFAHLPEKTSSYLRRKLRTLSRIKVEYRSSVEGLEEQLHALYQSTRTNSRVQYGDFDELHPRYFQSVLESCGDRARLMLCWSGDTLVSFQLFMDGEEEVVAKFIGMRYPEARELNLYFINWIMMFRHAIERGIWRVRMGNTSYSVKLLLGGHLEKSWIFFRHLNPAVNWVFHRAAPMMDYEKNDPELRQLAEKAGRPAKE